MVFCNVITHNFVDKNFQNKQLMLPVKRKTLVTGSSKLDTATTIVVNSFWGTHSTKYQHFWQFTQNAGNKHAMGHSRLSFYKEPPIRLLCAEPNCTNFLSASNMNQSNSCIHGGSSSRGLASLGTSCIITIDAGT
jgi:hypothetical protein